MAAPTVYDNVAEDADVGGQLFAGKKFWVAQRVPMRTKFLADIRSNGGEVVILEKHADYMIADHFRRDCPPGSISYKFIEESLKKGEIQDPESHLAGPPIGTARAAGAAARPTKGGRTAYTADEDRILYKWVRDSEGQGGLASGNEIYKQLEAKVGDASTSLRTCMLMGKVPATHMAVMARSLLEAAAQSTSVCLQHTRQCPSIASFR